MAGKEKKATLARHLSKENLSEKEKTGSPDTAKRTRGRKSLKGTDSDKEVVTPVKRGRKKKSDVAAEAAKTTPQRGGRKPFLEKELEDILENATGRNTPSEAERSTPGRRRDEGLPIDAAFFVPKSRRDMDDDNISVRSLTTFLRARKVDKEVEDDVLSLRSVKLRKDDEDSVSVRSLPAKKPKNKPPPTKVKLKAARPKKNAETKVIGKKAALKTKDNKRAPKKPVRFQNKMGAQRRSNLLIKKKVKNAQNAVKKIRKRKAEKMNESNKSQGLTTAETNGEVTVKAEKKTKAKVAPAKPKAVAANKGTKASVAKSTPAVGAGAKKAQKRRWQPTFHFETTQSPDDSSVIIVQPRIGPKMRKILKGAVEPSESPTAVPATTVPNGSLPAATPAVPPGPISPNAAPSSTPYFIQNMPNFSVVKSQPNVQGDWLVTPTGVVLIQAVPPGERGTRVENPEAMSTSLTPVVSPPPSGSASAQTDSALSEKAKEAEPAQGVALPLIPVAKNVSELLLLKSQMDELTSPTADVESTEEEKSPAVRTAGSERRASHDGSFGPVPSRVVLRTGSCERLTTRSPRSILQLGSEPLPLADGVRMFETDSSFSLRVPLRVPSPAKLKISPTTESGAEIVSSSCTTPVSVKSESALEIVPCKMELETEDISTTLLEPAVAITTDTPETTSTTQSLVPSPPCPTPPASPLPQVQSADSNTFSESETNLPNGVPMTEKEGNWVLMDVTRRSVNAKEDSLPVPRRLSEDKESVRKCQKDEHRGPGRTKKYSRSLDSRQKLLPGLRRRSNPEPRIINIVTCEDGSRQGPTLVEELREQCSRDAMLGGDGKVPYLNPAPASSPKPVVQETPEELASKETILSALGLQSLKAAAESAQKKKERVPVVGNSSNNNYTGTLKTVIKIQRPEKKGNGRMIYKASSAATGPESVAVEEELLPDGTAITKESHESGDEDGKNGGGKAKSLVIPEKASSFSIHPHRMCSDVCTYCFGKFGLLDTPCHVAQLKDSEKRRNILSSETHLTLDSCLCDACFRHVDKKSNCPSFTEKKPSKRKLMPRRVVQCCVVNCDLEAQHNVRRKVLLKLKKSLGKKLLLDQNKVEKMQPAHMITLCNRHIYWVDYFMSCGICNKRLNNVHMYRVGSEANELNAVLGLDSIPTVLTDKRFLCKLCQCYASLRLKSKNPNEITSSQRNFLQSCKRRILQGHGVDNPDSEAEGETEGESSTKNGKNGKAVKKLKPSSTVTNGIEDEGENSRKSDNGGKSEGSSDDLRELRAKFRAHPAPSTGFHKFSTTIQFTPEIKNMFYDLQRPYGNHSSFLRHLILLEKYFRNGDLVVSRNANPQAVKYVGGVQNRLRSYEGLPQVTSRPFTLTPVPAAATSSASSSSSSTPVTTITTSTSASTSGVSTTTSPLSQMQATVQSIGLKPDISIMSVGQEPRKLTPKIQENLRALANRSSKPSGQTRAVILNRTVGGQKQSLVQVTTGGKTIHLTLSQFRRIQQMQLRKKQFMENQTKPKGKSSKVNGPSESDSSASTFPNIPKALSVSVTKVPAVDLTKSPPGSD